jgi:biotin operon repressor
MSNFLNIKFENHKVPEFKEVKNKDWVYYGEDNKYPEYLIELSLRSAKHGAILNGKTNYICGGGIGVVTKGSSLESQALANQFIKQINKDGFYRRMIQDLELFNGFYIEPIFNKTGRKLVSINYVPFNKIRVNADESVYYYSNDWSTSNQTPEKTGFKEFRPFDENNIQTNMLYYYKIISPKNAKEKNVYPVPEYIGGCASIETDIEIANYHLNNIKTGFSVGTIINFNNGTSDEPGRAAIEKQIKAKFQGTDKAGSLAITFNQSADNAPTITSFAPSDLDKQFIEIGKRVEQDIFTSHKLTSPMLVGVKTEGQLGGRNELIEAFELFQNTYVEIRQKMIEDVLNYFGEIYGLTSQLEIKRVQAVQRNLPDVIIQKVYDAYPVEQLAEIMGLPKIRKVVPIAMEKQEGDIYEVLFSREWNGESDEDAILEFQKMSFKSELTSNERAIVDLLSKDELMPSEGIAKILKISEAEVNKIIDSLNKGGYLEETSATNKGTDIVEKEGAKTEMLKVLYKYDWRPGVTPDKNSREFCVEAMNRYGKQSGWQTREQIESLKNDLGTDVWSTRGGWWNNGKANVPFCRHNWFQQIVKNK